MAYVKMFLIICFIALLAGCSTLAKKDKAFEEGYRLGAKENISDFAGHFMGNDFPYFYWSGPVVQNVRIPAHINNGVFVPEHIEPVVIKPAQWRKEFTYPITSSKTSEGGSDYALSYIDLSVRDITVLPEAFICAKPTGQDKDTH